MDGMHRARYGERAALSEHATLPKPPCVHQPGGSPNPIPLGFYGSLITYI